MNRSTASNWRVARLLGFAMVVLAMALSGFAQVQTGNMFGKVVDADGASLPGVTVTLSGVGASQVFVTDAQGAFRFLNLDPGFYTLSAELAGFGSVVRSGVQVNIGRSTNITMELTPALEQTITVTAETPLLDVRKTGTGATVTEIELEEIPTARDPWAILQQVPGVLVDRINVGGSESGQQANFVGKGTGGDQATFNVDGVNITDMAATGSSSQYYDFGSFEEIQISTGGSDPRIQTPGVQINMVSKRGTNEYSGSGRAYITDGEYQADASVPAEAQAYLGLPNEIDSITDYGFEIGGPIVRDRLWAWGSYSDQQIDLFVAQPPGQERRFTDKTKLENFSIKVNGQLTSSNSAAANYWEAEKVKLGRNVGPSRPPETAWNQGGFGDPENYKIEDTHIFSPNFYLTGRYNKANGGFNLIPDSNQGCTSSACARATGQVARLDYADGFWNNTFYYYETIRPQDAYRADGSAFFDTGDLNHELRFGFGYRETPVSSVSGWPEDQYVVLYQGLFGLPDTAGGVALMRQSDSNYEMQYNDFYVGDTILWNNFTFQVGLRYDNQEGFTKDGHTAANPVIPDILTAVDYDASTAGKVEWESIAPRLGVTYATGGDNRLLLRAAYNQYVDQLGAGIVTPPSPLYYYQYLYYYFNDENENGRAERSEIYFEGGPFDNGIYGWGYLDPTDPGRSTPFNRYDSGMDAPTTDEFILGFEYEVLPEFTVGVNYTNRTYKDTIWLRPEKGLGSGNYYTSADYEVAGTLTSTLPNGQTTTVTYYDLKPGVDPPVNFVVTNRDDYKQKYDGVELNLVKRLSNRWMARANLSFNDWTQDVGPNGYIDPSPNRAGYGCTSCDGSAVVQGSGTGSGAKGGVYINSGWSFNITGLYQIPVIDVNFGASVIGREGYPIPYVHGVSTNEGFKRVLVDGVEPARLEDIFQLDLRLSKEFTFLNDVGLTISVDAFNVTDEQAILQRNTEIFRNGDPRTTGNQITELQSPQVFRFGARLTF